MVNQNIGCTVTECKHHAKTQQYCSLNSINIVKHSGSSITTKECTDCGSFESDMK